MTVFVCHSMTLKERAEQEKARLETAGHIVLMPSDPTNHTEEHIIVMNAHRMKVFADVVFAIWDGISDGCYGDVCIAMALDKPAYVEIVRKPVLNWGLIQDKAMRRAWTLFAELPKIEQWWVEQEKEKPPPE